MHRRKSTRNAVMLIGFPLLGIVLFYAAERHLLHKGVLNKRDIGFVGGESGSFYEYVTNVWHWDVMGVVLIVASGILVLRGMWLIVSKRK